MKKLILLFLFILSIPSFSFSQSGWLLLRPYPNNVEHIQSFYFPNKNTGYITNNFNYYDYSVLYKTTNAGLTWQRLFLSTTQIIKSLCFLNSEFGFSSISNGIYKTTNGGYNWIFKGGGGEAYPQAITFANDSIGYSVHRGTTTYGPRIYKTINGGENWQYIDPNLPGEYLDMYDIKFFNANTGLFCGEMNYLLRTTNGGYNWNFVHSTDYGIFYSICILNDSTTFVAGNNGKFFKSTNQGLNWINYSYNSTYFEKIEFFDDNTGFAIYSQSLDGGKLIKTTNGGYTWELKLVIPDYETEYFFHFFNKNEGYAYQVFGDLMKTSNGGDNWYTETPRDNFKSISIINENTGYSGGVLGNLYKTTNGSANWSDVVWTIKKSFSGSSINDIYFLNLKKGLVLSDSGNIFITNDSSNSWSTINVGTNSSLKRVCFLDNNTGVVIGKNGAVLKTTNAGSNWMLININSSINLNGICKTPTGSLFICGDTSFILKSTNAGNNWNIISTPSTKHLNSITFKNDNFGFIVGDSASCYKTSNGGLNWQYQSYLKTNENLNSATWFNDSSVCVVGNNHTIRITKNNGLIWGTPIEQPGAPGYDIIYHGNYNLVHFINSNLGFICGSFGLIIRTLDGGGALVSTNNISTIIPDKYTLSQNYPNPFNPTTSIKYSVSSTQNVKLIIYNILGKGIETLVNEKQSPGTYEVNWNGSDYPSEVYFYRLQAGDFTETKKMILIK